MSSSAEFKSLSNMPLWKSDSLSGGSWVRDYFLPTPPMPTYLLAFVVGSLGFNSKVTEHNLKVRASQSFSFLIHLLM